jgi:hypothetical protein
MTNESNTERDDKRYEKTELIPLLSGRSMNGPVALVIFAWAMLPAAEYCNETLAHACASKIPPLPHAPKYNRIET